MFILILFLIVYLFFLEIRYGVETKYLEVNFSKNDTGNYKKIANVLKDLDIGVLVNNVGIGCTSRFLEVPNRSEFLDKAIDINVKPTFKVVFIFKINKTFYFSLGINLD